MRIFAEPKPSSELKATSLHCIAWCQRSAGVKERRHADTGSPRNLGALVFSPWRDAAGGVEQAVRADGEGARAVGAKRARRGVRRNEGNEVTPEGAREVGVC